MRLTTALIGGLVSVITPTMLGTPTATTAFSTTTTSIIVSVVCLSRTASKNKKMNLQDIIEAYFYARKNKRRSPDQVEFELHWEMNCVKLCNEVNKRQVRPTAYTFVVDIPKPREVFASDMSTRILHHYLDMRLRPLLEARMSMHTFNNRIGMGTNACQNAVISDIYEVSKGFTEDAWIIKLDLKGCFPNINQDIAYEQIKEVVTNDYFGDDKDDVLYILQVCIFSYPTYHCYRKGKMSDWDKIPKEKSLFTKPDGIGGAIGHLIWQNAVNYYFHEIDEFAIGNGIRYERYVDDMYFVVNNKTAFLTYAIPIVRCKLKTLGARLNESKFYYQHYTKGVECLGVHIKMDRIYPNKRVINRAKQKVCNFNRCVRVSKIDTLLASINSYLGVCKNINGYNQSRKFMRLLSKRWFKYVEYDKTRVCLVAQPQYKINKRIITKFYEARRKERVVATTQRKAD